MGKVIFTRQQRNRFDLKKYLAHTTYINQERVNAALALPRPVYSQQKFGPTKHWLWVLGKPGGEKDNFERMDFTF